MNILYLCDEYPPGRHGGIGTAVQILACEMVRQGHKVIVAGFYDWGYGGEDEFEDVGVKVYRFRRGLDSKIFSNKDSLIVRGLYRLLTMSGIFEWDIKRSLKKYHAFLENVISEHKIDIIEMPDYNDYMRFCNSYVPFPALSAPTVIKLHGCMTYFAKEAGKNMPVHIEQMEHDLLQQGDGIAAVSKYTAMKTAIYLSYDKEIEVLYNGINAITFDTDVPRKLQRVIFTGTLVEKKGIFQLAKAWNEVNKKIPSAELWIFGKGEEKKVKHYLNDTALKTVFFKGHVTRTDLFKHIAESTIAIFPSYAECFALAPMEAMACGTAVIFTSRTSGPELIEDGITGLLADPGDVKSIAEKIIYLLRNPDICSRLRMAGRNYVTEKFNIKIIAENNIKYYDKHIKSYNKNEYYKRK